MSSRSQSIHGGRHIYTHGIVPTQLGRMDTHTSDPLQPLCVNTNTDFAQPSHVPKSFQQQHGHVLLLTQRAGISTFKARSVPSWERESPELLH